MESNKDFYLNRLDGNNVLSPRVVGWDNVQKAEARYAKALEKVVEIVRETCKTPYIVDIGCGVGLFADYLHEHYRNQYFYIGTDLVDEYIERARNIAFSRGYANSCMFFGQEFNASILCSDMAPDFVVIYVMLGTFTLNYDNSNLLVALDNEMSKLSKSGVYYGVVNGYHSMVDYRDSKLHYFDFENLITAAIAYTDNVQMEVFEKYEFFMTLKGQKF